MSRTQTYVGFGFGAIQAGLFLLEAHRGGCFQRLVVAEVLDDEVAALRREHGRYRVNVAGEHGIDIYAVDGVDVYNPRHAGDRENLIAAVAEATEIGTALPSVDFYTRGNDASVAGILAAGFAQRKEPGIVYAAENHNHAAELLAAAVKSAAGNNSDQPPIEYLNTVIGKMSGIITDPVQIREQGLAPATLGGNRCFLVEAFNRILISRIRFPRFSRGLFVFEEKDDLLPFEEAKLYGHNAVHALLGYHAQRAGLLSMHEAAEYPEMMAEARAAFLEESGKAMLARHHGIDPLFTETGFKAYADDLLRRMVNPNLQDRVERIIRDPRRKLGWDDRLVGAMRLVYAHGIEPVRFARAAAYALQFLCRVEKSDPDEILREIWSPAAAQRGEQDIIRKRIMEAYGDGDPDIFRV